MPRGKRPTLAVVPNPDPVAWSDVVESLPDNFLQCREMRHRWVPWSASWSATEGCYRRVLHCDRCETDRISVLDEHGAVLFSHYDYADGYLVSGYGRVPGSADAYRLASVIRAIGPRPVAAPTRRPRRRREEAS